MARQRTELSPYALSLLGHLFDREAARLISEVEGVDVSGHVVHRRRQADGILPFGSQPTPEQEHARYAVALAYCETFGVDVPDWIGEPPDPADLEPGPVAPTSLDALAAGLARYARRGKASAERALLFLALSRLRGRKYTLHLLADRIRHARRQGLTDRSTTTGGLAADVLLVEEALMDRTRSDRSRSDSTHPSSTPVHHEA